jgi:hypothetical protein
MGVLATFAIVSLILGWILTKIQKLFEKSNLEKDLFGL